MRVSWFACSCLLLRTHLHHHVAHTCMHEAQAAAARAHAQTGPHAAELQRPSQQAPRHAVPSLDTACKTLFAWSAPVSPHLAAEQEGTKIACAMRCKAGVWQRHQTQVCMSAIQAGGRADIPSAALVGCTPAEDVRHFQRMSACSMNPDHQRLRCGRSNCGGDCRSSRPVRAQVTTSGASWVPAGYNS